MFYNTKWHKLKDPRLENDAIFDLATNWDQIRDKLKLLDKYLHLRYMYSTQAWSDYFAFCM